MNIHPPLPPINALATDGPGLGPVYMIPRNWDEMRDEIILMYWNKSRLMIQQNITIFLGVDYTILGNHRMLKQQQ